MCQDCHSSLTTDEWVLKSIFLWSSLSPSLNFSRSPMASFINMKSAITSLHLVHNRGHMITASEDKQIKVILLLSNRTVIVYLGLPLLLSDSAIASITVVYSDFPTFSPFHPSCPPSLLLFLLSSLSPSLPPFSLSLIPFFSFPSLFSYGISIRWWWTTDSCCDATQLEVNCYLYYIIVKILSLFLTKWLLLVVVNAWHQIILLENSASKIQWMIALHVIIVCKIILIIIIPILKLYLLPSSDW